jgi:hypothetical protein
MTASSSLPSVVADRCFVFGHKRTTGPRRLPHRVHRPTACNTSREANTGIQHRISLSIQGLWIQRSLSYNPLPLPMYLLLREGMVSRDQPFGEDGKVSLRAEVKLSTNRDSSTISKNNSSYSTSETFVTDAFLLHQQSWPELRASLEEDLRDTTGVPGSLRGTGAS